MVGICNNTAIFSYYANSLFTFSMRQLQPSEREIQQAMQAYQHHIQPLIEYKARILARALLRYVLTGPKTLLDTTPVELNQLPYDAEVQKKLDWADARMEEIYQTYKNKLQ